MKTLLATTLAGLLLASAAYGQGTVAFQNFFGNVTDPVVYYAYLGGPRISGTQYIAGLQAGPTSGSEVEVAGATAPFFTGSLAGFFGGGTVSIPNVAGGATAFIRIEVWDTTLNGTTTGATFAQAVAYFQANPSGLGIAGLSSEFSVVTGDPDATPPGMPALFNSGPNPLRSFGLFGTPEPSTFSLVGLGAAVLMIFHRRK